MGSKQEEFILINANQLLNGCYGLNKTNYDFAYPNGELAQNRTHQVLIRFGVLFSNMKWLMGQLVERNDDDFLCVLFKQVAVNADIALSIKRTCLS